MPGKAAALLYALAIAAQVLRKRPAPRDALPLAAVLVTMHLTWGAGFLQSALRTLPRRRALRIDQPRPLYRPLP